jgi:hypothetical protein
LATWLVVASVQVGGILVQRWGRPSALMLAGVIVWGVCLLLPSADPVIVLVVLGLIQGLPLGVIMSLPGEVLHPASCGTGMGLFFTWLYLGHASLPPTAGWLQDVSGDADVPIYFAGVLVFLILPLSAAFRLLQRRLVRPAPVPVTSA